MTPTDWMGSSTTGMGSFPPINIFQQGDDFVAIVELPGVDKNDLGIDVKENTIRISGKKTINYDEGASVHRRERVWGVFDRTLSVPIQIDPDAVKAEYHNGLVRLVAAIAKDQPARNVEVHAA